MTQVSADWAQTPPVAVLVVWIPGTMLTRNLYLAQASRHKQVARYTTEELKKHPSFRQSSVFPCHCSDTTPPQQLEQVFTPRQIEHSRDVLPLSSFHMSAVRRVPSVERSSSSSSIGGTLHCTACAPISASAISSSDRVRSYRASSRVVSVPAISSGMNRVRSHHSHGTVVSL